MAEPLKLLVINSNTDEKTTARVADVVRQLAPEAEVSAVTGGYGPHGIGGRADITVSGLATLEAGLAAAPGQDAAIVACFSDPGLHALRELLAIPVVGIGEASFLTARMLGARFSVVTVGARVAPLVEEAVALTGLATRFGGVTLVDDGVLTSPDPLPVFAEGIERAVRLQGAEAVVIGGAAFAGLAAPLNDLSPVPVVGSVEAAVVQALALARLGTAKARLGSYSAPARKRMRNLSPILESALGLGGTP